MATMYTAELRHGIFHRRRVRFDFDMLAWFILYDELGWDFEAIAKKPTEETITRMMYAAAKSHAIKSGRRFRLTVADIVRILERSRTVDSDRLKEVFAKSAREVPALLAEKTRKGGGGNEKKKQDGMIL